MINWTSVFFPKCILCPTFFFYSSIKVYKSVLNIYTLIKTILITFLECSLLNFDWFHIHSLDSEKREM